MREEIDGRQFTASAIGYDCQSGSWSAAYEIFDPMTGAKIKKNFTWDRARFGPLACPKHVFGDLIARYREGRVL